MDTKNLSLPLPEKHAYAGEPSSDPKSEPSQSKEAKDEPSETPRYVLDEISKDFKSLPPPYSPVTIALDQNFITQHPKKLLVRQRRGWTGHDFNVQSVEGTDLLLCRGSLMSKTGRRVISTPSGEVLWTLRRELKSLTFANYWLEDSRGQKILTLNRQDWWLLSSVYATFTNVVGDKREVVLNMRDYSEGISKPLENQILEVLCRDTPVARITRAQLRYMEATKQDSAYQVEVAVGVDWALISTLVLVIDELMKMGTGQAKKGGIAPFASGSGAGVSMGAAHSKGAGAAGC